MGEDQLAEGERAMYARDNRREAAGLLRKLLAHLPLTSPQDVALVRRVEGAVVALDLIDEGGMEATTDEA